MISLTAHPTVSCLTALFLLVSFPLATLAEQVELPNHDESTKQITQHDIVPLMLLRCAACHGGRRKEGGLDLRSKAAMLKGGKSGPALVIGSPQESLIIQRMEAKEMPPRRQLVDVSVKPMQPAEIAKLKQWITNGLPESSQTPDIATTQPDALVTDEHRAFWSFQSPRWTPPPSIDPSAAASNAIDAFILKKLQTQQLDLSPEADRWALLRRVSFDLTGLPPSPEDIARFVTNTDPLAYEKLVERLLASPRYGERWGRYFLDVAGYADSEGGENSDRVRPNMWRYRDYVIQSFTMDKPYDRFLHEQIAGDELADYENAEAITPELYNNLVATGFLRTAPDRTFANITNFVPERLEVIADEIQIFGSAVLGLTIHCARCHEHKFDPIPQRDYYRLAAVLKDAYDEHDWLKPQGPRTLKYVTPAERNAWKTHTAQLNQQVEPLKKKIEAEQNEEKKKQLEEQLNEFESRRKPEPQIRALWSRGEPSPTYILIRGNYLTPGREVGPGVPAVLTPNGTPFVHQPPWQNAQKTGRRLALAHWLTEPEHPLTARVMVNRIWKNHFGQGIVRTLDNFGLTGAKPTHPALLDWLAIEFVRRGWSIKAMHRLMMLSNTYRQSSQLVSDRLSADPDNQLFSSMPLKRMEAETLRDSLLFLANQLNETPFGPPDAVDTHEDGLVISKRSSHGWRRSIYVLQRRTTIPTMLESFGFPQMGPNCLERSHSITSPQALHMLNDSQVHQWSRQFADRVRSQAGDDRQGQITLAHLFAFGRPPSQQQQTIANKLLDTLTANWQRELKDQVDTEHQATQLALANYCHAVINSSAFIYID